MSNSIYEASDCHRAGTTTMNDPLASYTVHGPIQESAALLLPMMWLMKGEVGQIPYMKI